MNLEEFIFKLQDNLPDFEEEVKELKVVFAETTTFVEFTYHSDIYSVDLVDLLVECKDGVDPVVTGILMQALIRS